MKTERPSTRSRILFVCVENSCRSKMAEAIFNHLAKARGLEAVALSAGTNPAERANPLAIDVLREIGIEIVDEKPKLLTQDLIEGADRIVTMGCLAEDICPAVFLLKAEDWALEDPSGKPIEKFREIRDIIRVKVEKMILELL